MGAILAKTTACGYGSPLSRGRREESEAFGSSPSISSGSAITTRPLARSTVGTTALVDGSNTAERLVGRRHRGKSNQIGVVIFVVLGRRQLVAGDIEFDAVEPLNVV